MVLIKDDQFRQALVNHRKEITELKEQLTEFKNKNKEVENPIVNSIDSTQDSRINLLENELKRMNERYISLLEKLLEIIGNQKSENSNTTSNTEPIETEETIKIPKKTPKTPKTTNFGLDSYQILFILDKSKANSPEFAVTSNQLKLAFNINKTEKTIRNKLLALTSQGFISTLGQKPKKFFLTEAGLNLISQEQNKIIR
jgi:hypothetical protein